MDESDHEMSDEAESDNEAWAGLIPGPDERMEQCKLGGKVLKLPELFLEKVSPPFLLLYYIYLFHLKTASLDLILIVIVILFRNMLPLT